MKRSLQVLLIIVCTFMVLNSSAQETSQPQNDVRLSYGFLPASEIAIAWLEILSVDMPHTIFHDSILNSKFSSYGTFVLQYQHQFNKVIHFGGVFTFNPISSTYLFKQGATESDSWLTFSLMPRLDFYYINRGIFSMYSGIALGVSYFYCHADYSDQPDQTFNTLFWAYQVNIMGIRIGKEIGGFIEFGFGYQGIINLGISAKL